MTYNEKLKRIQEISERIGISIPSEFIIPRKVSLREQREIIQQKRADTNESIIKSLEKKRKN